MNRKKCPVCNSPSELFYRDSRDFHKCVVCDFVHAPCGYGVAAEERHYKDQWANQDETFWSSQADVILEVAARMRKPKRILDFGSGSGRLTRALRKRGYDVTPYEPMNDGPLAEQWYNEAFDTVIGLEVIEHIADPHTALAELETLVTTDAQLFFVTLLATDILAGDDAAERFGQWWYKDDPTHTSFYGARSVATLAASRHWKSSVFGTKMFALHP